MKSAMEQYGKSLQRGPSCWWVQSIYVPERTDNMIRQTVSKAEANPGTTAVILLPLSRGHALKLRAMKVKHFKRVSRQDVTLSTRATLTTCGLIDGEAPCAAAFAAGQGFT